METGADSAVEPDVAIDAAPDVVLMPTNAVTRSGPVVGRTDGTVRSFLGIPYAAPPIGNLRWRPPQEPASWSAPLEASTRALACPQRADMFGNMVAFSEDCLKLNVWAPQGASDAARRPVMVFIHGGGYGSGAGSEPLYEGRALAARGNVVVVTVNYRLGQLGFLAHARLTAEDTEHHSSGNYGLMDQQLALRWVRDNIASFGGDPSNVTLFGESAGGMSVCLHMVSPLSRGLFHRAVQQSGPCTFTKTTLHDNTSTPYQSAESLGFRYASAFACQAVADPLGCLRAKTTEQVIDMLPTPFELTIARARFQPNIDGYVIPEDPAVAFREGRVADVPLLLGTNRDEGTAFSLQLRVTTADEYEAAVHSMLPDHVADVLRLYPASAYPSPKKAFEDFLADALFTCPAREIARQHAGRGQRTWLYRFTRENQGGRLLGLGVFHAAELPYVFDNFVGIFSRQRGDSEVAALTQGYWTRFATTGDPNGAGAPAWPAYDATGDRHLELTDAPRTDSGLRRDKCDAILPWIREL